MLNRTQEDLIIFLIRHYWEEVFENIQNPSDAINIMRDWALDRRRDLSDNFNSQCLTSVLGALPVDDTHITEIVNSLNHLNKFYLDRDKVAKSSLERLGNPGDSNIEDVQFYICCVSNIYLHFVIAGQNEERYITDEDIHDMNILDQDLPEGDEDMHSMASPETEKLSHLVRGF